MTPELKERFDREIRENPIVLYMKGNTLFPRCGFSAAALEARMLDYIAARKDLLVHHEARKAEFTTMTQTAEATWDISQTMVDPEGENDWVIEASIDLSGDTDEALPLLSLRAIREV